MKIIFDDESVYTLVQVDSHAFTVRQKKITTPYPIPYRDGWNDPNDEEIDRIYKTIKIGDKYYAIEPSVTIINKQ